MASIFALTAVKHMEAYGINHSTGEHFYRSSTKMCTYCMLVCFNSIDLIVSDVSSLVNSGHERTAI